MGGRDDDPVAELGRDRRNRWMNRAVPLGIVVVVLAGAIGYAAISGKHRRLGEPCERTSDCAGPRASCFVAVAGSICTVNCDSAGDCPGGWACRLSDLLNETGAKTGTMLKVCVRD